MAQTVQPAQPAQPAPGQRGPESAADLRTMRHSAAHVLAEAVQQLFPDAASGSARPSRTASTTTSTCPAP